MALPFIASMLLRSVAQTAMRQVLGGALGGARGGIRLSVEFDGAGLRRKLENIQKQTRFAAAKALTQTAAAVKAAVPDELDRVLDRPVPFTKRGLYIRAARRDNLQAEVGFMPKQAEYMRYQIAGGVRSPGRGGLKLPSAIQLNEFGNIPKGTITQLIAVANKERKLGKVKARRIRVSSSVELFYGDPADVGGKNYPRGIYKRIQLGGGRGQLVPIVVFPNSSARYQARFDFRRLAQTVVDRDFDRFFKVAFADAMKSTR